MNTSKKWRKPLFRQPKQGQGAFGPLPLLWFGWPGGPKAPPAAKRRRPPGPPGKLRHNPAQKRAY